MSKLILMNFWYDSFVDRDMLMRYHWGLGVGHVGMGAVRSVEDSALSLPSKIVSGDDSRPEGDDPNPDGDDPSPDDLTPDSCTPGLDPNSHGLRTPDRTGDAEDSSEEENALGKSIGDQDSDSENPDSEPDDPRRDKQELDHHEMFGDDNNDEWTSYD